MLLSDSSSEDEEEKPVTDEDIGAMLDMHSYQKQCRTEFYKDNEVGTFF